MKVFEDASAEAESWLIASIDTSCEGSCVSVILKAAASLSKGHSKASHLCSTLLNISLKSSDQSRCEAFAGAAASLMNQGDDSGHDNPVKTAMKGLCIPKKLSIVNKRLPYDLFSLASLVFKIHLIMHDFDICFNIAN